ncbi:uncharacterized protein LODBEIA_P56710 [Lodderomyces beijingensis]|uniref:RNA polymerase II-associated protein RBA50 n=1 Tax=Lodderomyces beijingensis TaxID=1775926 RepID=A0ABP0ZWF8_9ASCO
MDFVGEIVEHETEAPLAPTALNATSGFPDPSKRKVSRWKQNKQQSSPKPPSTAAIAPRFEPTGNDSSSEMERINKENTDKLARMSNDEIVREQQDIMNQFDPKLLEGLLRRSKAREGAANEMASPFAHREHGHEHEHAEGYNGWIGEIKTDQGLRSISHLDKDEAAQVLGDVAHDSEKKKVTFDDSKTEIVEAEPQKQDEIAPDGYQIGEDELEEGEQQNNTVHFTKPTSEEIDLDDPQFFDKLHEKYYPDLPKETEKLSWMTTPVAAQVSTTYESISDMRFDFKGNLVQITVDDEEETETEGEERKNKGIPTYLGLHHHSENPQLAGYTLSELAHLSRSVVASQRSLSIQTLGRILHKLGLHQYNILPIPESEQDANLKEMVTHFEQMMWDLIDQLRIVDSLTEAADEKKTKNLSVRSYAIEALWLLKTGGGPPKAST